MRYFKYRREQIGSQIISFIDNGAAVNTFSFSDSDMLLLSIGADTAAVDELLNMQPQQLIVEELDADGFAALAKESEHEIGMMKRAPDDPKRVAYEAYVDGCKLDGDARKAGIGYM